MRAWTASAIRNYYLDPEIVFLSAGHSDPGRVRLSQTGYYVTPHCEPDCCQAFGRVSGSSFGPFRTPADARAWSARNLGITRRQEMPTATVACWPCWTDPAAAPPIAVPGRHKCAKQRCAAFRTEIGARRHRCRAMTPRSADSPSRRKRPIGLQSQGARTRPLFRIEQGTCRAQNRHPGDHATRL
jgi:hypothetical protein